MKRVTAILPIAVEIIALAESNIVLAVCALFLVFVPVCVIPSCRGSESAWVFVLAAFSGVSLNLLACREVCFHLAAGRGGEMIWGWILLVVLYVFLFSAEQIVLGVITRTIWKKQAMMNWQQLSKEHSS